jgi:DNA repair protein RadC
MTETENKVSLYELRKVQSDFPCIKVSTTMDSANFIRRFYGDDIEIFESFFILLLNRANMTVGYAKISQGGTAGTVVDLKIIAKYAVDSLAHSVIMAHNHPSGNIYPSPQDISLTEKANKALDLLDIDVVDHIILTKESYYSFAENGKL